MAYTITNTLTNLTASGDTTITSTATVTLSAATGYRVPANITVSGADYTYDDYTDVTKGVISLSNPTGNVTITAVGLTEEERFNSDMDGIVDTINAKAGTTGDKYLPQVKHTAAGIVPLSSVPQKAAATITPTGTAQSIAAGQYLSGAQTVEGIVCENLTAENIADGVVVKVGTATDDDSVTTVTGTYEGGGGGGSGTPVIVGFIVPVWHNTVTVTVKQETSNGNNICIDTDGNDYDGTNGVFQYKIGGTWTGGSGTWTNLSAGTTTINPGSTWYGKIWFRFLNTTSQKPFGLYAFYGIFEYQMSIQIENNHNSYRVTPLIELRDYPEPPTLPINFDSIYWPSGGNGSHHVALWGISGEED